jgi:hypothetical protein
MSSTFAWQLGIQTQLCTYQAFGLTVAILTALVSTYIMLTEVDF